MPAYTPTSTAYAQGNLTWLRTSKGLKTALTVTLDLAVGFVLGTHYPAGYLPSGLVLGKITASGKYAIYSNAAADGREVAAGFLLNSESTLAGTTVPIVTALITEGDVIEGRLPSGHGLDAPAKVDFGSRFTFVAT